MPAKNRSVKRDWPCVAPSQPPKFGSGNPALILIDVQAGFDEPRWGPRNNPHAEATMGDLLKHWRRAGRPVFHVQHMSNEPGSPLRPGVPGNAIKPVVAPAPGEPVLTKTVNSGFIGTDLEARLRASGITEVVLAGITTDHCVSTTARMAANLGFRTFVVSDATFTHDRTGPDGTTIPAGVVHRVELATLHGEFATVVRSAELLGKLVEAVPSGRPHPE